MCQHPPLAWPRDHFKSRIFASWKCPKGSCLSSNQFVAQRVQFLAAVTSFALLVAFCVPLHQATADEKLTENFEIQKGEHISLIGNTLADRMQHDGWLETYLQSRFPKHNLDYSQLGLLGR